MNIFFYSFEKLNYSIQVLSRIIQSWIASGIS